jgi:ABC-type sugar transport system ATPase subunit
MPGDGTGALIVEGLKKAYGPTEALRGLSFQARREHLTGVVGPNGAGKSTLVKILAGEEKEDEGTVELDGRPLSLELRRHLVAVVHQEPQLFPNLTVTENVLVGRKGLRRPRPATDVTRLLDELQLSAVANIALEETSIMVWQLTEVARALLRSAEVFLFDEPNSALTREESLRLFEHMTALRNAGKLVFLVSHRLAEVAALCTEVIVVRDGTICATLSGEEVSSEHISSLLTAEGLSPSGEHETAAYAPEPRSQPMSRAGLQMASSLAADARRPRNRIEGVPGQVIAVTGPEGGGGRELVRTATLPSEVTKDKGAAARGRAYVPADRRECLYFNMSVAANISCRLDRSQLSEGHRLISRRALASAATSYIEGFHIKAENPNVGIGSLSGGNQQKVALASALAAKPDLLVIEEPTRGVDITTKLQIYEILRKFTASGGAVVMYVNELEDAIGCADMLYVVKDHAICGCLTVTRSTDLEALGLAVNKLLSREADNAA